MKFKFLGTAAAEGIPAMFCSCEKCKKAFELGGNNLRSRSQAIINDKLLIDFPCDTFYHFNINHIDFTEVKHCLITHGHSDHYYKSDLEYFRVGYSHPPKGYTFNIYGSEDISSLQYIADKSNGILIYHYVKPFEPFIVDDFTVTALKAVHTTKNPYFYSIKDKKNAVLYALDTDYFPEDSWNCLKELKTLYDIVVFDCTNGTTLEMPYVGHSCFGVNDRCRQRLKEYGLVHENTKYIVNHFSHNGENILYDDMLPLAEKYGFIVSYDGMEVMV